MKKTKVYLVYSEIRSGGEICKGEENDSWPSHEDTVIDFIPKYILITDNVESSPYDYSNSYENLEDHITVDELNRKKELHLLIVRYSDGSTFGRTTGHHYILNCYTNWANADKAMQSFKPDTYTGYKPWDGYFSSFEGIEMHTLNIRKRK